MSEYVIVTDSACDIDRETLAEWGVEYCELSFMFNSEDKMYKNYDLAAKDFFNRMREGAVAKTSAANTEDFIAIFEPILEKGIDILYLGFSSGLSTTYNCARMAAEDLSEKYPDRKILTLDTLSASAGFGMMLYLTVLEKKKGADIETAYSFAEQLVPNMCHWFTVDDLVYLKRGGRVSPTVAFVGGMLNIKPVLHMDIEGHLISRFKAHGRKKAIEALADKYGELGRNVGEDDTVFICHGDCLEDAQKLGSIVKEKYGADIHYYADIGPVIGAHAGPGTLAIFFVGKER